MFSRTLFLRESLSDHFNGCDYEDGTLIAAPTETTCPNCLKTLTPKMNDGFGVTTVIFRVLIYTGHCLNCGYSVSYDGAQHCFINWNNSFLLSYESLLSYLNMYASDGVALQTWLSTMVNTNAMLYPEYFTEERVQSLLNHRSHVVEAMAGGAELIAYPPSAFKCCQNPRVISMDGTVISVHADRLPEFVRPWMQPAISQRATTRQQRQLPPLTPAEKNLVNLMICPGNIAITISSHQNLPAAMDSCTAKVLIACTNYYTLIEQPNTHRHTPITLPHQLHSLALFLVKTVAPVDTLIPAAVQHLLPALQTAGWEIGLEGRLLLQDHAPILYSLLLYFLQTFPPNSARWVSLHEFLQAAAEVLEFCRGADDSNLYHSLSPEEQQAIYSQLKHPNCPNPTLNEVWATGWYFPGFPICRQMHDISIRAAAVETECEKNTKQPGTCGPGIVLVFCNDHNTCIGVIFQDRAESPALVFETLVSRFPVMPEVVIYDNACNLYEYAMNRIPSLFSKTRFFVDNFHYHSHENCAPTFDTHKHPRLTSNVNTSLTEQSNAILTNSKRLAPTYRFRVFVAFTIYSIFRMNSFKCEGRF
jgi:hypothetical protein